MTKSSDLDKLHTLYTKELTRQLKEPELDKDGNPLRPNAALLSVVGAFLYRSGTKAVSDSPAHQRLARAYEALPFTTTDEPSAPRAYAPTTEKEVQH
jgi:hypothetical protein